MELYQEDSSEKYSTDEQGEYAPGAGMQKFLVQGLTAASATLDSEVTEVQPLTEEYALLLRSLWWTDLDTQGLPCSTGTLVWSLTY